MYYSSMQDDIFKNQAIDNCRSNNHRQGLVI